MYLIKQEYFKTKKYLNYYDINKILVDNHQFDYYNLPTKVSQQTLKMVDQNFKSFFKHIKSKNKSKKVNIPKYLDKNGRYITIYTNQSISKIELKNGFVKLSGTDVKIKTKHKDIQQVRIIHKGNHIVVEVIYITQEKPLKDNNGRYVSIDLGLNNLCTLGSNIIRPIIINGKPLKSINQYYNKKISKLKSDLQLKTKQKNIK